MTNKQALDKLDEIIGEYIDHCYAEGFTKTANATQRKRIKYTIQLQAALEELEELRKNKLTSIFDTIKQEHMKRELNKLWLWLTSAKWGGEYHFNNIHPGGKDTYSMDCNFGSLHCGLAIQRVYFDDGITKLKLTKKDIEKMVQIVHGKMNTKEWEDIK